MRNLGLVIVLCLLASNAAHASSTFWRCREAGDGLEFVATRESSRNTSAWALSGNGRNGIRVARRSSATTLISEQDATTLKIQRTEPALSRKDVWIGEIDSVELRISSDLNAEL